MLLRSRVAAAVAEKAKRAGGAEGWHDGQSARATAGGMARLAQVCSVWHALSVPCCIVSCSLILLSGLSSRSAIGVRGCLQPEDAVVVFVRSCGSVCNKQPLQFAHMLDIARRRVCTHLCQFFAHTCARACALASAHAPLCVCFCTCLSVFLLFRMLSSRMVSWE